jgi:hypothetical protein
MSGTRIQVPGRFKSCTHLACFDLPTLVEINKRARKWQCPHCLHNSSLDQLIIDPYFHRVLGIFSHEFDSDNTDLEIGPDGSWRAFLSGDAKKRAGGVAPRWHKPEETTFVPPPAEEQAPVAVKKEEHARRGSGVLKIRLKRERGDALGGWQIDRQANGESERPAKLQKTEGEGGSSDRKSDVNKHLQGGKGKNVVIDLSDSSDDDEEDIVIARRAPANGRSEAQGSLEKGSRQQGDKGIHDLLAAAGVVEGPASSGVATSTEVQPRGSPNAAESRATAAVLDDGLWGNVNQERREGGGRRLTR